MKKLIQFILVHFFRFKESHLLIILQNNNELRSTGGYITAVLDLTLGKWRIKKRFLNVNTDLHRHEKVEAPKIIQEMLFDGHLKTWTFRDANYDPDFQKSGQKMAEFYNKVYPNQRVSGILALNFSFMEDILSLLGALKIDKNQIHSGNFFEYLTNISSDIDRHDKKELENRKHSLQKIGKKTFLTLIKKPWKWPKGLKLVQEAFRKRDLQLYPSKGGCDFKAGPNEDFFAVIENNYLGLKSNRYLHRSVQHHSVMDNEGRLKNSVKINWRHFGVPNYPMSGYYKAHIRVYLNGEATLKPHEMYEIQKEGGFIILSFKIALNPGEVKEMNFEYESPPYFQEKGYNFRYFKQAGVKHENLKKTFSLPLLFEFSKTQNLDQQENIVHKSISNLKEDFLFKVFFQKSQKHPTLYSHEIISKNLILIKFNQAIELHHAKIKIWEKNKFENKIEIISFKKLNNNKWLLIELKNLPEIEGQFFTVFMKDVFNDNRVAIKPNPRTVTVVYRSKNFKRWENNPLLSF